ncbi:unnamed protein product [Urochloa humidicola]
MILTSGAAEARWTCGSGRGGLQEQQRRQEGEALRVDLGVVRPRASPLGTIPRRSHFASLFYRASVPEPEATAVGLSTVQQHRTAKPAALPRAR